MRSLGKIKLLLCLLSTINAGASETILFFIGGASSYSHRSGLDPLASALALRGHNVTFFSPIPPNIPNPNITDINPPDLVHKNEQFLYQFGVGGLHTKLKRRSALDMSTGLSAYDLGLQMCRDLLNNQQFQSLASSPTGFDLMIIDKSSFSECAYGLAWKWQAKVISYMAMAFTSVLDFYNHGIPSESSWIPAFDVEFSSPTMDFKARVLTEISHLLWYYKAVYYYAPRLQALMKANFEDSKSTRVPNPMDLIRRESIVFANQHYSDTYPKSLPPFMVPVGGMAVTPGKNKLPRDIENFLMNSSFIYVSFGSIVKFSSAPASQLNEFMQAFRALENYKFLVKWEGQAPQHAPANVLFRTWFPQMDVLGHPRIKAFMTQGGQISIQEAVYSGVPLIILPVFPDQGFNAKRVRQIGNGIDLELFNLTSSDLVHAINRITSDPKFQGTASRLSRASRNRPVTPLQTAVWWTEFVLSEPDLSYLKPQTGGQSWIALRSLDVFAFLFGSLLLVIFLIGFFVGTVISILGKAIRLCLTGARTRKLKSS